MAVSAVQAFGGRNAVLPPHLPVRVMQLGQRHRGDRPVDERPNIFNAHPALNWGKSYDGRRCSIGASRPRASRRHHRYSGISSIPRVSGCVKDRGNSLCGRSRGG
jgi:hypothetical protein